MYLFRNSPLAALVPHNPALHGYACNYIGGDSGPEVVAQDYYLYRDLGKWAVFQHIPSCAYYAAVRIGKPSNCPCGDDWRQEQAHLRRASEGIAGAELTGSVGPWMFYDLVYALEAGVVAPEEARAAGYVDDAIYSLNGHLRDLGCSTPEEALALLHIIDGGKGESDINTCVS